MMNINFSEETAKVFIDLAENYINESNKKTQELKSSLEEIFLKTNYEKIGIIINEFLKLYNVTICEELNPKLVSIWGDSQSSLLGYLKNLGAGEEAEEYARKVENDIIELLTKKNSKFELLPLNGTDTPEADEIMFSVIKDKFEDFSRSMEELGDSYISSINKLAEDNKIYIAFLPLAEAISQGVQLFTHESVRTIDNLKDDFVNKLNKSIGAATSKDNMQKSIGGASTFKGFTVPFGTSNKSRGGKGNKKYINELRKYAQRFRRERTDYNVLKDFTRYLYNKLETGLKEIPLNIVDQVMVLYENYFTEFGANLKILKDDWEKHCDDPYKYIIVHENDKYFADDSDRWTYRSHYTNLAVYGIVARMVRKLCSEYDFRSLYRSFYVIYDIILDSTTISEEDIAKYSDFSLQVSDLLYEIIGEEPEQIEISNEADELKLLEERIIRGEQYLKEIIAEMKRLTEAYGKDVANLLDKPATSKNQKSSKKTNNLQQRKYKVSDEIIQKMSYYCQEVKILKDRQLNKFKESYDNSDENVQTLIGMCKGLLDIAGAFPVFKAIPFDISKAYSGVEKFLNAPKIKKFLTTDIMNILNKYRNHSGNFIFNYTLEYHNYKYHNIRSKAPYFMPLNMLAFDEPKDELRDKIENAFLGAWKYSMIDDNYKVSYNNVNNPNNPKIWAQCFTGTFIKLFKAGLLSQGVSDMESNIIVDELIPLLSQAYNGIKPDLSIDPGKRYVRI